jgi:hypothetical protein
LTGGGRAAERRFYRTTQIVLGYEEGRWRLPIAGHKTKETLVLKENKEMGPSREEPEVSFSDLGDVTLTRARAIKLAGAALAGSAFSLLWAGEADARKKKKRKKRRRRRRKAQVTPNPVPLIPGGDNVLTVTNPSDRPLTISGVEVLDNQGNLLFDALAGDVTIAPNTTAPVTLTVDLNDPVVDADRLRLIDGRGNPITVVDENGVNVGGIDVL